MAKLEYSDFKWKRDKLYSPDGVYWGKIVADTEHDNMWKILWAGNGEFSTDYWNKTRARDNFVKMATFLNNMAEESLNRDTVPAPEMSTGALKHNTLGHPTTPKKITHPELDWN